MLLVPGAEIPRGEQVEGFKSKQSHGAKHGGIERLKTESGKIISALTAEVHW